MENSRFKFRAWEKNMKIMMPVENIDFLAKQINTNSVWRMFHEIELMQSTGLEDMNGVEIYLDDILSDEYGRKYIAVFKGDCVRCDAIRPGGKNRWISNHLEVIGNIHENPELLEVAE